MAIRDLVPKFGRQRETLPARRADTDPFRLFQREMNRLFDDFFTDGDLTPWRGGMEVPATDAFTPRVDVSESASEVRVCAELPGLDEKGVTVEMDDNTLTLRGEKRLENEHKDGRWTRREQYYGAFHRVVSLPAAVDSQNAKAKFKRGMLVVTAPKREPGEQRRKTVAIESA